MKLAPILLFAAMGTGGATAQELNLYTSREPGLVEPLLQAFTQSTGTKVNTVLSLIHI